MPLIFSQYERCEVPFRLSLFPNGFSFQTPFISLLKFIPFSDAIQMLFECKPAVPYIRRKPDRELETAIIVIAHYSKIS